MNSHSVATLSPDIEVARAAKTLPIGGTATSLGIPDDNLHACGTTSAKIDLGYLANRLARGNLILVNVMIPSLAGEGRTIVTVGLGDGLNRIGRNAVMREPSRGPFFGMKSGAIANGGRLDASFLVVGLLSGSASIQVLERGLSLFEEVLQRLFLQLTHPSPSVLGGMQLGDGLHIVLPGFG